MPIAVIVDWYGPYFAYNDFRTDVKSWPRGTRTLYMALGPRNLFNYIGLTEDPEGRFEWHPNMQHEGNRKFFAGKITSQGVSGRRSRVAKPDLYIAEHALIRYFMPALNDRRKLNDPEDCVVIYSRFFDKIDGETPITPLPKFPSVIAYNSWSGEWDA